MISEKSLAKEKVCKILLGVLFVVMVLNTLPIVFCADGGVRFEPEVPTYSEYFRLNTNLLPFKSFVSYGTLLSENRINTDIAIKNIAGNIALFLPIGCLLALIYGKKALKPACISLCAAVILETVQFILRSGACDIDDVILRMLGALLGYIITQTVISLLSSRKRQRAAYEA